MRSPLEVNAYPSKFIGLEGILYKNVNMFDGVHSENLQKVLPSSLQEMYIQLIDHARVQYATIFRLMLSNNTGISLFHCTAGKDRTGMVAMLLLSLAGVSDELIAADYAVSAGHLKRSFHKEKEQLKAAGLTLPENVFESPAEVMLEMLQYLKETYGGAEGYLRHIGLTSDERLRLKQKLVSVS